MIERRETGGETALAEVDESVAAESEKPVFVKDEVALERIRELTTTARTTWLVLIGFLAFIGLTLLSVRDVDFFSVAATTDLPIVNIAIPTTTFFWTAALLAAILHTYFHVFLLKLWDALAEAPPTIDELKLGDRVFPWLVNDWALGYRRDDARSKRPIDSLSRRVTDLVIWWLTPIVLAGFWVRSMPAHIAWLTLAIGGALVVTLFATLRCKRWAKRRLRESTGNMTDEAVGRARVDRWLAGAFHKLGVTLFWVFLVPAIIATSVLGAGWHHLPEVASKYLDDHWPHDRLKVPFAGANLANAQIAVRPQDWRDRETARERFHVSWCRDKGITKDACEAPEHPYQARARERWCLSRGIDDCERTFSTLDAEFEADWVKERALYLSNIVKFDLTNRDLRRAWMPRAFLAGVDFEGTRLEGANLTGADLREVLKLQRAKLARADLSGARLEGAELHGARLEGADLSEARLEGTDLRWARLDGADLSGARLQRANLRRANLEEAELTEARLEGADLGVTRLQGAKLSRADLNGANLYQANLEGANLRVARLQRANLRGANLEGADLTEARLQQAILGEAGLEGANLSWAGVEGANLWRAQLQGANLYQANLEGANLRVARLQGANLWRARLQSVEWAGATFGPSPAYSADFTDGSSLTQNQLDNVVGNYWTLLPRDAQTGEPLHVWSCWEEEAAARFIEIWTAHRDVAPDKLRKELIDDRWICGPDNPRRPAGTPAEDVVGGYR